MKTVQLILNKVWNVGPVYASQIKRLRKRILVELAPLWASSYTHLQYKAQDPFRKCRQSNVLKQVLEFGTMHAVYASQIKRLRKRL